MSKLPLEFNLSREILKDVDNTIFRAKALLSVKDELLTTTGHKNAGLIYCVDYGGKRVEFDLSRGLCNNIGLVKLWDEYDDFYYHNITNLEEYEKYYGLKKGYHIDIISILFYNFCHANDLPYSEFYPVGEIYRDESNYLKENMNRWKLLEYLIDAFMEIRYTSKLTW